MVHVGDVRGQLWKHNPFLLPFLLSFLSSFISLVDSRMLTEVMRFGRISLYLLSHLTIPE